MINYREKNATKRVLRAAAVLPWLEEMYPSFMQAICAWVCEWRCFKIQGGEFASGCVDVATEKTINYFGFWGVLCKISLGLAEARSTESHF